MNKKPAKIAIIGNAGSGKSTLAQKLHTITNLPIYYLDQYFWKPGWVKTDPDEYKKIHDAICDKQEWIIDGINLRVMEYRIQRADVIIFLDLPRYVCIWRIFKRTIQNYGKETSSSAKGCPERFNGAFFKFLKWVWNFKHEYPAKIREILTRYPEKKIYIFKSQRDVDAFMRDLMNNL